MAEGVIAFSLAANIIQFIDFSSKLTARFWAFYRSSRDSREAFPDIQGITDDLKNVLEGLIALDPHDSGSCSGIRQLAADCHVVATDLCDMLTRLSLSISKEGKREAIKAAFRSIWKEDEISHLQKRLDHFRSQLTIHLLANVRQQSRESLYQQKEVLKKMESVLQSTTSLQGIVENIETYSGGFGSLMVKLLCSKFESWERKDSERQWRQTLFDALLRDSDSSKERTSTPEIPEHQKNSMTRKLLSQLRYPRMTDREERIAEAHADTFQWIFSDPSEANRQWSNFKAWLQSDSQLYWMTGKAGSGKSTLMKYICQPETPSHDGEALAFPNPRYYQYLETWADGSRLIAATFFFWNSGEPLQMTQSGLMRSLLYQILINIPELLPAVSPWRWEALCLFNDDFSQAWTNHELESMLRSFVTIMPSNIKLCLFIDGLDEFERDHLVLIRLFKDLLSNCNVKLCASSRPWNVFEDAFEHSPSLMLQDLTYDDIKLFASFELHANPAFTLLQEREPHYAKELVENIVSKAAGVFLWVRLVLSSLLAGIGYGDRIVDLQRRLEILPAELEQLYEKMLKSIDPFYLEHAAQLFKLLEESINPPSILLMSFADEDHPDFALERPIQHMSQKEAMIRWDTMRRRLNSRSKGFLEVSPLKVPQDQEPSTSQIDRLTVQYLHRTVKDYVRSRQVQSLLRASMVTPFDPHLKLCAASLATLKAIDPSIIRPNTHGSSIWTVISTCMYSASRINSKHHNQTIMLMDELDKTGTSLFRSVSQEVKSEVSENGPGSSVNSFERIQWLYETGQWAALHPNAHVEPFGCHFLSLAVRYGVVPYVKARAAPRCLIQKFDVDDPMLDLWSRPRDKLYPLLIDAISCSDVWSGSLSDSVPCPNMIACLLDKGASFNWIYSSDSFTFRPWYQLMKNLVAARHDEDKVKLQLWMEVAKLAIQKSDIILSKSTFELYFPDLVLNSPDTMRDILQWLISISPQEQETPTKSSWFSFLLD